MEDLLRQTFRPDFIDLDDDGGISGVIASNQFRDMPVLERQTLVETALRKGPHKLTKAELRHVLAIAPLTLPEYHSVGPRKR